MPDLSGSRGRALLWAGLLASSLVAILALVALSPRLNLLDLGLLNGAYLGLSVLAAAIVIACCRLPNLFRVTNDPGEIRTRWMVAAVLATGVTLPLFQVFKQVVLPARGFPLDSVIMPLERTLLGGQDGWEITHAVFGSLWPTLVFDTAYAVWLPMMFLFPMVVATSIDDAQARGRLIGTWVASWVFIGSLGAWFLGSAGPCYFNDLVGQHDGFARLHAALQGIDGQARQFGLSIHALYFQNMLEATQAGRVDFASGISAMPSMHVAMASLFAIAGFRRSRFCGALFSAYAVTIWVASVHLGWHYALDGVIGTAMMLSLWAMSGPIARSLNRL